MFCFQCEQTMRTEAEAGCATTKGVCGKDEATADLQDLLIHQVKGIGQYRARLGALGQTDHEADSFVLFALFTTLTNVNFNRTRFVALIAEAARVRDRLRTAYEAATGRVPDLLDGPASFVPADTLSGLLAQAAAVGVRAGIETAGADVIGLRALLLYGLKGVAAYAHHAEVLGQRRDAISDGIARALDVLAANLTDLNALLEEIFGARPLQLCGNGSARRGQHRHVRHTRACIGARHADRRQSDPGFRP
jgi:hydroxylamine reductase